MYDLNHVVPADEDVPEGATLLSCQQGLEYYLENTVGADGTSCHPEAITAYNAYYLGVNEDNEPASEDEIESGRQVLDFVVYILCEYCCDTIPCGDQNGDHPPYEDLAAANSLFDAGRKNSWLHVAADNCKVYPHFEAEYNGEMIDMCATVDQWKGNKGNKEITEKMETALFGLAHRYGCANKVVWENCYTMEEEFGRMLASDANC